MSALFWFRAWFRTKTMSYILRQDAYNHSQSVLLLLLPMIFIDLLRRSLSSQPKDARRQLLIPVSSPKNTSRCRELFQKPQLLRCRCNCSAAEDRRACQSRADAGMLLHTCLVPATPG